MSKQKYLLLFLIILLGTLTVASKTIRAQEDNSKKKEIKKYENIVFLGDSITEFYPITEIYGDLPIVKSGISGYTTQDIIDRLEKMIYQYNPTSVFLLIGTNDILYNKEGDKEKAIAGIKKIVNSIHKKRPNTKIYVESLFPINEELDSTKNMIGDRSNDTIQEINSEIKQYCRDHQYTYIEMYHELTDEDGNFAKEYTNDGLHPNDLGYAKITTLLLPYIYGIK